MTNQIKTILPDSSGDWEKRLDTAIGERLTEISIQTEHLWNPWKCPTWWLPYLAYAVAVGVWREEWTEQTRRQVVANSIETNATAGTRVALENALKDIGFKTKIVEWFETTPKKKAGTFEVTVFEEDESDVPGQELQEYILETIDRIKSFRSHYQFKNGRLYASGLKLRSDIKNVVWIRKTFSEKV